MNCEEWLSCCVLCQMPVYVTVYVCVLCPVPDACVRDGSDQQPDTLLLWQRPPRSHLPLVHHQERHPGRPITSQRGTVGPHLPLNHWFPSSGSRTHFICPYIFGFLLKKHSRKRKTLNEKVNSMILVSDFMKKRKENLRSYIN